MSTIKILSIFLFVLFLAVIGNEIVFAKEQVESVPSAAVEDELLTRPITDAKTLDELWEYYFKEKDPRAVQRIISVMHWVEDGTGMQIALGGAARWSVESNARQHADVYEICKDQIQQAGGITRRLLEEIVSAIDKERQE